MRLKQLWVNNGVVKRCSQHNRQERSILKDTEGSQIEEKESASYALDQTPTSGKDMKESLFSVDLCIGREEDDSYVGEKMQ